MSGAYFRGPQAVRRRCLGATVPLALSCVNERECILTIANSRSSLFDVRVSLPSQGTPAVSVRAAHPATSQAARAHNAHNSATEDDGPWSAPSRGCRVTPRPRPRALILSETARVARPAYDSQEALTVSHEVASAGLGGGGRRTTAARRPYSSAACPQLPPPRLVAATTWPRRSAP